MEKRYELDGQRLEKTGLKPTGRCLLFQMSVVLGLDIIHKPKKVNAPLTINNSNPNL